VTTDPTAQQIENPAAQPTAPPTVPPASPNADQHAASSASVPRRLVRRTDDKLLGGVCSGLAAHLGLDPTIVRLVTVVVTVLGFGSVALAYVVAWVIVPAETSARGGAAHASSALTPHPPAG